MNANSHFGILGYLLVMYTILLMSFIIWTTNRTGLKLQLHDAIYRLRFYSNSLIHILSPSNSHSNVASIQKNWVINLVLSFDDNWSCFKTAESTCIIWKIEV